MGRSLSLRARLILGVIALAAVGLVAADVATYSALRSFLIDRTDTSLEAAHVAVEGALFHDPATAGPITAGRDQAASDAGSRVAHRGSAGRHVQVRRLDGHVLLTGSAPRFPGSERRRRRRRCPRTISLPARQHGERVALLHRRRRRAAAAGTACAPRSSRRDEELPPRRRARR